jgi:hypothetical protein
MKTWCKDGGTIEQLSGSGVFSVGALVVRGVQEGVVFDHVGAHVVGPFEDLWLDIDEEGVGRPTPKNHDLVDGGDR